jgi:hypothetical protein
MDKNVCFLTPRQYQTPTQNEMPTQRDVLALNNVH